MLFLHNLTDFSLFQENYEGIFEFYRKRAFIWYKNISSSIIIAKHPPCAGFLSLSGGAAPSLGRTWRPFGAAFGGGKRNKQKYLGRLWCPLVLKLPQGHQDSEYVLSFEIGQRESDFCSERTDRITDKQNHANIQYRIII